MVHIKLVLLLSIISLNSLQAQFNSYDIGLSANVVYTTSAEIFLNPNSSDPVVRNQSFTLEDIFSPSIDVRYRLSDDFILSLNIEYIKKTLMAPNLTAFIGNSVLVIEVEDGFRVIPVELTAHYFFPFSTEQFKFLMGAGIGYYNGEFIREFVDTDLSVVQRKFALGIHVSTSMDYMVLENFSLRFEMKFRDPQYEVNSKYTKTEVIYQGETISLPENSFNTKVNLDGLTFILGMVYHI
jgi:outer membrane protein W